MINQFYFHTHFNQLIKVFVDELRENLHASVTDALAYEQTLNDQEIKSYLTHTAGGTQTQLWLDIDSLIKFLNSQAAQDHSNSIKFGYSNDTTQVVLDQVSKGAKLISLDFIKNSTTYYDIRGKKCVKDAKQDLSSLERLYPKFLALNYEPDVTSAEYRLSKQLEVNTDDQQALVDRFKSSIEDIVKTIWSLTPEGRACIDQAMQTAIDRVVYPMDTKDLIKAGNSSKSKSK